MTRTWGFGAGAGVGVALALVAFVLSGAHGVGETPSSSPFGVWIEENLGQSVWLFAVVLTLYAFNLHRLRNLLRGDAIAREIVEVEQLIDVWIQLFIGIGVIWTAVGMRSALIAALSDPNAALNDTAGNVLSRLVEGGVLVALTTTIVGGVGGYLMRLVKAMLVGPALHEYFEARERVELREVVASLERIEAALAVAAPPGRSVGASGPPA